MNTPVISLCVCCRNAAYRIENTLLSLLYQTADRMQYEILVVDNGSDDRTKLNSVIKKVESSKSIIRLLTEPKVGLSNARNRAARESLADYVYYIDDDALANVRLVEHYLKNIEKYKPDVIGGNCLPLFLRLPPREIDSYYWPQWSLKHFGNVDRWLSEGEYFIGTNIGALKKILLSHPFNPELGRKGEKLIGGEEWFLGDARYRRRFVAGSYVFHVVPESRMDINYLAQRFSASMNQKNLRINRRQMGFLCLKFVKSEIKILLKKVLFQIRLISKIR